MWLACGQCPELIIEDVKDEIFDMVKPANPLQITAKDLLVSFSTSLTLSGSLRSRYTERLDCAA